MKRNDLLKYLRSQECEFIREGSRHSWWWNPSQNKRSSVPRHTDVVLHIKLSQKGGFYSN